MVHGKYVRCRRLGLGRLTGLLLAVTLAAVAIGHTAAPASAESYVPVSGAGSSWSANALDQWISDVDQYGMRVNYAPTGSSDGRHQFLNGTVDFAASDIPFQTHPEDGSAPEQPQNFAYMPITAGGTVFMYNLSINGQQVTNLRLSGENVVKIFTGVITHWDDPALAADNPGLALPGRPIVPVVRSDGSGSTAQFSLWMISQYKNLWDAYCRKAGRYPKCGETSYYPTISSMVAQNGDLGVAGYVAQSYAAGAIGYVNYSYALNAKFPVAKVLNTAGFYTEPTANNVAVSLLKAEVETTDTDPQRYLTQKLGGVYNDTDPRTYPLSSYSYLILPTKVGGQFTTAKGKTLAAFSYYSMCEGQKEAPSLGYSPMPINLVRASFDQIKKIPGAVVQNVNVENCHNPTFSTSSPNLLADTAPMPPDCDKQGAAQCGTGTGGDKQATPTAGAPSSDGQGSTQGGSSSSPSGGGSTGGGATSTGGSGGNSGSTGRSGSSGGPSTNGPSGSSSSNVNSAPSCDPSSGSCGAASGDATSGSSVGAPTGGVAVSGAAGAANQSALASNASAPSSLATTLAARHGWTNAQTLMLVMAALILVLLFAPGLIVRYLTRSTE